MSAITLAVLGGSGVATPALIQALLDWTGHVQHRPELRVVLLGRSLEKLERVRVVCEQMVRDAHPIINIEATTDLRVGLKKANYVLNQVRVGGLEARAHDETTAFRALFRLPQPRGRTAHHGSPADHPRPTPADCTGAALGGRRGC